MPKSVAFVEESNEWILHLSVSRLYVVDCGMYTGVA